VSRRDTFGIADISGEAKGIEVACDFKVSMVETVKLITMGVRNMILPTAQSINGLYQESQLCPRMTEKLVSNCVT
jgi:hypothetical protein